MNDPSRAISDPIAHPMVIEIRDAIVDATGASLVGLFLYGSLATREFEPDVSDIDLIAVPTVAPDEQRASRLSDARSPRWSEPGVGRPDRSRLRLGTRT